jgi:hypothetical protein
MVFDGLIGQSVNQGSMKTAGHDRVEAIAKAQDAIFGVPN